MKARLSVLIPIILVGACSSVEFENAPAGSVIACDAVLPGWWQVETLKSRDDVETPFLNIGAKCETWHIVERDEDGTLDKPEALDSDHAINIVAVGDTRYIVATERKETEGGKHLVTLLRYVSKDKGIVVHDGDPKVAAHLVVDGVINGKVEAESNHSADSKNDSTVQVVVSGNAEAVAGLLKQHPLIDRPFAELQRVDAKTRAELDAHLNSPAPAGKPKPHE